MLFLRALIALTQLPPKPIQFIQAFMILPFLATAARVLLCETAVPGFPAKELRWILRSFPQSKTNLQHDTCGLPGFRV